MKTSFYNIFAPNDRNVIGYNTKNDIFCVLSNSDYHLLTTDINKLQCQSPKLYNLLVDKAFIVDEESNETADLYAEYKRSTCSDSILYLTILPTLDCNLRC